MQYRRSNEMICSLQRGFIHNFRHNKKESQSMKSNRITLKVTFDLINIVEFNLT